LRRWLPQETLHLNNKSATAFTLLPHSETKCTICDHHGYFCPSLVRDINAADKKVPIIVNASQQIQGSANVALPLQSSEWLRPQTGKVHQSVHYT
jgi:hypothetical protein